MTIKATGAYLRTLREYQKLTRDQVAETAGTSVSQLVRIEAGEQDTRSTLLAKITAAVSGDPAHIFALVLDDAADELAGQRLAQQHIAILEAGTAGDSRDLQPEDVAFLRHVRNELLQLNDLDRLRTEATIRGLFLGFNASKRS